MNQQQLSSRYAHETNSREGNRLSTRSTTELEWVRHLSKEDRAFAVYRIIQRLEAPARRKNP